MLFADQDVQYSLSKFEKILFSIAVFVFFLFYGILNLGFAYGFYSPYISASLNMVMGMIAFGLFVKSLFCREFSRFNYSLYSLFLYSAMATFMVVIFKASDSGGREGLSNYYDYGNLFRIYVLYSYSIVPFFLFFMPRNRFLFFANNSWLVYIPSLISSLIVIIYSLDIANDWHSSMTMGGVINRATIKIPLCVLTSVSFCWMIFNKGINLKFIFGVLGFCIGYYGVLKTSSQSSLISLGLIAILVFILSLFRWRTLVRYFSLGVISIIFAIPLLITSRGMERLYNVMEIREAYYYGGYDVSRIDLAMQGMRLFLESPFLGGNAFLSTGLYTHLFIIDILMATGIIGMILCLIVFWAMYKGFIYGVKNMPDGFYWILMVGVFYFSQQFFHGNLMSIVGVFSGIFLSLYFIYKKS